MAVPDAFKTVKCVFFSPTESIPISQLFSVCPSQNRKALPPPAGSQRKSPCWFPVHKDSLKLGNSVLCSQRVSGWQPTSKAWFRHGGVRIGSRMGINNKQVKVRRMESDYFQAEFKEFSLLLKTALFFSKGFYYWQNLFWFLCCVCVQSRLNGNYTQ